MATGSTEDKRMDRRQFSLGLALSSVALSSKLGLAQQAKESNPAAPTQAPQPAKKRRWEIYEEEYFDRPLVFERKDINRLCNQLRSAEE